MNRTIYLAGGCFWGTQKYLDQIDGVLETEVGFANGHTEHPSYEEVCHNNTGHAETVRVVYDSQKLPLAKLLGFYFRSINPTSVNREQLQELGKHYDQPIAVECLPLANFYPAEEYHQKYLEKNPNGYCHLDPGLFEQAYEQSRAK